MNQGGGKELVPFPASTPLYNYSVLTGPLIYDYVNSSTFILFEFCTLLSASRHVERIQHRAKRQVDTGLALLPLRQRVLPEVLDRPCTGDGSKMRGWSKRTHQVQRLTIGTGAYACKSLKLDQAVRA